MNKLENIKSSEDLIKKAGSHDIELSKELAEEGFALLFKEQELSEEELANIVGHPRPEEEKP